jgi:hypothetical protein
MALLTNPYLIGGTAILWCSISIILSFAMRDWKWFSRSGAIITLSGGLLAARALLRLGLHGLYRAQHTINGGNVVPTPEELARYHQQWMDAQASHIGFWFIIVGTFIWGYGDLVGKLINRSKRV